MSYYINIQLFAVLAELKEMFLSLSLSPDVRGCAGGFTHK